MDIRENIRKIKEGLPSNVTLVAVSKTKPVDDILEAYDSGHLIFGENKVQDLVQKYETLPKDIEWHMIGHLQTNKVKHIAPFIHLIHAVDSLKLLKVINNEALKNGRVVSCLLQFHIASEETKYGLSLSEAEELLSSKDYMGLTNVGIQGVMGMATFTDDKGKIRKEFRTLKGIFDKLKSKYFRGEASFKEISMGMSDDYLLAIEEGSTLVRIGSSIFGPRNY
ncbi:UPF0001 protein YggS [hydrothermal vent metagenome]|uniref:UPF0001 protein YggS n=1 Tax=hydrothermal vent metagenome TaxID=652676 RepID=A0A3B0TZ44_9ZZZZ